MIIRKAALYNLGSSESKLMYTLHWLLLDAMDECCLEQNEKGITQHQDFNFPISSITVSNNFAFIGKSLQFVSTTFQRFPLWKILHSISLFVFQTFVYLFAPLCHIVRNTDFEQNLRLVSGQKIWSALWDFRHPDIESFIAQVWKSCFAKKVSQWKTFIIIFNLPSVLFVPGYFDK